jgi:hypothetical protein
LLKERRKKLCKRIDYKEELGESKDSMDTSGDKLEWMMMGGGGAAGELEEQQQQRNESSKSAELEVITQRQYLFLFLFVFVVACDYFGVVLGICVSELFLRRLEPIGLHPLRTRARRGDDIFGRICTRSVATIPELRRFSSPYAFFVTPKKDERTDKGRTDEFNQNDEHRATDGRTNGRIHSKRRTPSDGRTNGRIHSKRRTPSDGRTNGRIHSKRRTDGWLHLRSFDRLVVCSLTD